MIGNNPKNEVKQRMRSLLAYLRLKPKEFADATNVKHQQVSDANCGRNKKMPVEIIEACKKHYPNINVEWLISGDGEMLKEKEEVKPEPTSLETQTTATLLQVVNEQLEEIKFLKTQNRILQERCDDLWDKNNELAQQHNEDHNRILELLQRLPKPQFDYYPQHGIVAEPPPVSPQETDNPPQPTDNQQ